MSRQRTSRVNFDIDIKGINDAKELSQIMPKLIKQFNQLAGAVDQVEEQQEGIKAVKERIIMMDVGVIKNEITSLQQLGREYGSLVNQINALEKTGAPVAQLRKEAIEQHQRLREVIDSQSEETEVLSQSERELAQAAQQAGMSTSQLKNHLQQTGLSLNQFQNQVQKAGQYTRNASYVWLQAGYIMQDMPYGIRGVANNISQLVTAYQLLGQRVNEINQAQGSQITKMQALKSTIMGPTGVALLIGSILPSAIVLLERHWDDLFGATDKNTEALEAYMSKVEEFVQLQAELQNVFGEDPLGIIQSTEELEEYQKIAGNLREIESALTDLAKAQKSYYSAQAATGAYGIVGGTESREVINETSRALKEIRDEFGDLEKIDLEMLTEQIEQIEHSLAVSEALLKRSPLLQLQADVTQKTQQIIEDIEFFSDPSFEKELQQGALENAEAYMSYLEKSMLALTERGMIDSAKIVKEQLDNLRDAIEKQGKEEEESKTEDIDPIISQYEMRESAMKSLLDTRIYLAEMEVEEARTTEEKITAIQNQATQEMIALENQEFDNFYEKELAKRKLADETAQIIKEIERNALLEKLSQQETALKFTMETPQNFEGITNAINAFYDKKNEIAREAYKEEDKIQSEVFKNEVERKKALADAEATKTEKQIQMTKNYASAAVSTFQAIFQAFDASSRAQFQIQKIASASMAVINARQAYTKTLAMGGILAKPLAVSALLAGLAQAAAIMTQSYDSASSTGAGRGTSYNALTSYRGFAFGETGGGFSESYEGASLGNRPSPQNQMMPSEVKAVFTDGFGEVVSRGTLSLQKKNKDDLGYWGSN